MGKMSKAAYEKMIAENIAWLRKAAGMASAMEQICDIESREVTPHDAPEGPATELGHIIQVLQDSVRTYYPSPAEWTQSYHERTEAICGMSIAQKLELLNTILVSLQPASGEIMAYRDGRIGSYVRVRIGTARNQVGYQMEMRDEHFENDLGHRVESEFERMVRKLRLADSEDKTR
jgi:hypothetical protein